MTLVRPLFLLALALISFGLLTCTGFKSLVDLQKEYGIVNMPEAEDYPDDDAVIVVETHFTDIEIENNYNVVTTERVHRLKRLFRNLDDHGEIEIPIYSGEKLLSISARTIKPDGTVIPLKSSDFYHLSGQSEGSTFYTDRKSVKFTFPALEKGCYIEYEYTKFDELPFTMGRWNIQRSVPVLHNSYSLNIPAILLDHGWNWRYKAFNCDIGQPVVVRPIVRQTTLDYKILYTWTLKNVAAFRYESDMPPANNYMAHVRVAPADWATWDDVGRWYYGNFFKPRLQIDRSVQQQALVLSNGLKAEEERVKATYRFVADMRYVAVELGVGGIRPNFPNTVLDRGYGDCKDKSMLLIAMLEAMNIKAEPALVLTGDEGTVDPSFPSWSFNHMIVKAESGGNVYWMDLTARHYEPGSLPCVCEGINALVLHPDSTVTIERTPTSRPEDNIVHMTVDLDLRENLDLQGRVRIAYEGKEKFRKRNFFEDLSLEDKERYCRSLLIDEYVNVGVDSVTLEDGPDSTPMILTFRFEVPGAVRKQGDLYFVKQDPFKLLTNLRWLSNEKRRYPIRFNYPMTVRKNISLRLPPNALFIRNMPEPVRLSNPSFYYANRYEKVNEQHLASVEEFRINVADVPNVEYEQTRTFFDKVKRSIEEQVILTATK